MGADAMPLGLLRIAVELDFDIPGVPVTTAGEVKAGQVVLVIDHGLRQGQHTVVADGVPAHRVRSGTREDVKGKVDVVRLGVGLVLFPVFGEGDENDLQLRYAVLRLQLLEAFHLGKAVRTPIGPFIEDENSAGEIGDMLGTAVGGDQGNVVEGNDLLAKRGISGGSACMGGGRGEADKQDGGDKSGKKE